MNDTLVIVLGLLAILGISAGIVIAVGLITGLGLRGPGLASAGSIDSSGDTDSMTAVSDGWKPDHRYLSDSDSIWSWGFSGDAAGWDPLGADSFSSDSGGDGGND